jgi:tetratricopeptide (TPR) repeat protein
MSTRQRTTGLSLLHSTAREDLATAIRSGNAPRLCYLLLGDGDVPRIPRGRGTETELWDFKGDVPLDDLGWATVARHILAFHNNRGGVLLFGIRDGDHSFAGVKKRIDSKIFNDKIRKYVGDQLWVDFHREWIQSDQRYLGVAIVAPRGPVLGCFQADAPADAAGKREFRKGESALRVGDSSHVLKHEDAMAHQASLALPSDSPFAIDIPYFRILAFETHDFISRSELQAQIEHALSDPRTSITSLVGIGGSGKTTLATWAARRAFDRKQFGFIVSLTAKDRELGGLGIQSLRQAPTTFEVLLDTILDVLGFSELGGTPIEEREAEVRSLLEDSNGLLYVDNLETIDDPRVITFLDDLPIGVRALVTSRRAAVRVAVRPVDVGPLSQQEARALIASFKPEPGMGYVADLATAELDRIASSCDRLPLAIRWTLTRAGSAAEAVQRADSLASAAKRDDRQLLEFVFRRVFDSMSVVERDLMRVLSIFSEGSPMETLVAGTGHDAASVVDALDDLARDALALRRFDETRNDHVYVLAPLTRSFSLTELHRDQRAEQRIRHRLTQWYEATDVRDPADRTITRQVRQGHGATEHALVDLAVSAKDRGDFKSAQELFEQALSRNPSSWLAAREYAEFERHINRNLMRALELYERAAANAPAKGNDRSLIFREWAMLLRDSGRPDAVNEAIEKFEIARRETPHDPMLLHALASLYDRRGVYSKVIELLEPLKTHPSPRTRALALRLLVKAYERMGDIVQAAEAKHAYAEVEHVLDRR